MNNQAQRDRISQSGAFALASGLAVLGLSGETDQLHHDLIGSDTTLNSSGLIRCGRKSGASAKVVTLSRKSYASDQMPFIAIGHDGCFFLVTQYSDDGGFVIGRQDGQKPEVISVEDFEKSFSGEAILLGRARVNDQETGQNTTPFGWMLFLPNIKKYRASLSHAIGASLFIQIFALITPLFVMVIIDKVLSAGNMSTLDVLIVGLVAVAVFDLVIGGLRQYVFLPPAEASERQAIAEFDAMVGQARAQQQRVETIKQEILQLRAVRDGIAVSIDRVEAILPLITERVEGRGSLASDGYATRTSLLELEQELVERQQERRQLQFDLQKADADIAMAQERLQSTVADFEESLFDERARLDQEYGSLVQERIKAERRRDQQVLDSPIDGVVQELATTIGGVVEAAQALMKFVPDDSKLVAEVKLANRDAGFVDIRQKTRIKVETFEFTKVWRD